jgi:hypothetical protein
MHLVKAQLLESFSSAVMASRGFFETAGGSTFKESARAGHDVGVWIGRTNPA